MTRILFKFPILRDLKLLIRSWPTILDLDKPHYFRKFHVGIQNFIATNTAFQYGITTNLKYSEQRLCKCYHWCFKIEKNFPQVIISFDSSYFFSIWMILKVWFSNQMSKSILQSINTNFMSLVRDWPDKIRFIWSSWPRHTILFFLRIETFFKDLCLKNQNRQRCSVNYSWKNVTLLERNINFKVASYSKLTRLDCLGENENTKVIGFKLLKLILKTRPFHLIQKQKMWLSSNSWRGKM